MADKKVDSVLVKNNTERNEVLIKNRGKYNGYQKKLDITIGSSYNVYGNEKNTYYQHPDILRYTHNDKTEFSKELHNNYGVEVDNLKYYSQYNITPAYKVNDYEGYKDYLSYMWETYGREMSYAGHIMGLLGVRELAEELVYDVVPDIKGKTAADVINEIMQYTDVQYAMEGDKVGIVRDINVAMASKGIVTTNINNYSGKETKMGLITNRMYSATLLNAANFNSLRRTKYITPELETLYGNNLNNVYNLSSLFTINKETGRIAEPDTKLYLGKNIESGNVFDYLLTVNPEFKLPESGYDWSTHPNYGPNELSYKITSGGYTKIEEPSASFGLTDKIGLFVYSEGDNLNEAEVDYESYKLTNAETISPVAAVNLIDDVEVVEKTLLQKTNEFLRKRKVNTILSRFHDKTNNTGGIFQSSYSPTFGISHGRNLLTKNAWENGSADMVNNYSNPYCRVWTNHHQFSKVKHLIRPYINDNKFATLEDIQKDWHTFRDINGAKRLSTHSVLNKNGFVNITPTTGDDAVDIRNCMFSIENLAWKDVLGEKKGRYKNENGEMVLDNEPVLSDEQRGPNGGRIMWFPPYDLNFQETSSAKWSENEFIGRGEPVYTYVNSNRSGTLDFTILVDHPSIVNYWMKDKKTDVIENDEQTLLRFFAGCETLNPPDEGYDIIIDGNVIGNSKDPIDVNSEKDIIFYTFFPNNYSGKDEPNEALKKIFGGTNGKITLNDKEIPDVFRLGYEMGVNPISINEIGVITSERIETYFLESIYSYSQAESKFGDLKDFVVNENIQLNKKEDILTQHHEYGAADDKKKVEYYYTDFEKLVKSSSKAEENNNLLFDRISDLTIEISDIEIQKDSINEKINALKKEQDKFGEDEKETSAYYAIEREKTLLEEEIKTLQMAIDNKNAVIAMLEDTQIDVEILASEYQDIAQIIKDKFVMNNEFECTKPIFVCYNFQGEDIALKDEGTWKYEDAISAYAAYKKETLKTYFTNSATEKPLELLKERQNVACKTKYGKTDDKVAYWVVEYKSGRDIPFDENVFNKKQKFIKSDCDFGRNEDKTEYYVKYGGETNVFNKKQLAEDFIFNNGIIPTISEDEFKKSDLMCGTFGTGSEKKYMYLGIKSVNESEIINEFKKTLNDEAKNADDKEKYIIDKYYKNHKFGSLNDLGHGLNYGVIQLFFSSKLQETGESYTTAQDFIARYDILKHGGDKYSDEPKLYNIYESGNAKYLSETETDKSVMVGGFIKWDTTSNKEVHYPIDNGKETENISGINCFDMTSFGLNSTYEVVKKEMGDNDITFSFGEVYAALSDGGEAKSFVLSCERAILESVLGKTGEELETLVKEADERIEYLRKVFFPADGQTDLKITSVETWGTASSDGSQDKNEELANNREKTIQNFLKSLPIMKNVEISSSQDKLGDNIIDISKTAPKEINHIESKKAKYARTAIIVGNKDWSYEKRQQLEAERNISEDEKKRRTTRRYDNERLFFEMLKENDNIAYNRLVDKVKYFSPAFHSITPEGFNARLTFLQQCTRQGPTSTASDISTGTTASNLAFGRAPFCILRLGDFLNTKIVITSVNITYPDSMWDLNPEGIGVQFMMAKVSMQINIIGGSDISAPIKRLQNAVSFNYYANTSIYDNRSDNAKYVNGEAVIVKQWHPETVFDKQSDGESDE